MDLSIVERAVSEITFQLLGFKLTEMGLEMKHGIIIALLEKPNKKL